MQIPGAGERERELIFLLGTRAVPAEDSRDSSQPSGTSGPRDPGAVFWLLRALHVCEAQRREQANHSYTNK